MGKFSLYLVLLKILIMKITLPTKVKNIKGTSDQRFVIRDLRKKYKKLSRHQPTTCCAVKCHNPYEDTAHVIIRNSGSKKWWLIPTCNSHNGREEEYQVASVTAVAVTQVRKIKEKKKKQASISKEIKKSKKMKENKKS